MSRINITKLLLLITIALLLVSTGQTQAHGFADEIFFDVGQEKNEDIDIYRLGLKKNFGRTFLASQRDWLSGYFEGPFNYWQHIENDLFAIGLSLVFVYFFGSESNTVIPYLEGGIGVSFISETEIAGVNMGTAFQFEDRIGGGIRTGKIDANFRYMHYSNGSIVHPNDAIDSFVVTL